MSTFEEQFPGLVGWMAQDKLLGVVVRCSQVECNCLDTQKVKEVIEKNLVNNLKIKNILLKELGF